MKDSPIVLDSSSVLAEIKHIIIIAASSAAGFVCLIGFSFLPALITIALAEGIGSPNGPLHVFVSFLVYLIALNVSYIIYCVLCNCDALKYYCSIYFIALFMLGVLVGLLVLSMFVAICMVFASGILFLPGVETVREEERFCDAVVLVFLWEFFLRGVVLSSVLKYYSDHIAVNLVALFSGFLAFANGSNVVNSVMMQGVVGGYVFLIFKSIWPGFGMQMVFALLPGAPLHRNQLWKEEAFYLLNGIILVLLIVYVAAWFGKDELRLQWKKVMEDP